MMKKLLANLVWLVLCIMEISCGDASSGDNPEIVNGNDFRDRYVLVVYSRGGLGDRGFQDKVYYSVVSSADSLNFVLENALPSNAESAEEVVERFFKETESSAYARRLLVLASGEYVELLKKHPEWKESERNQILLLDSDDDSVDAFIRNISLYGASYMAGAAVSEFAMKKVAILAANSTSKSVIQAVTGFKSGYERENGETDTLDQVFYLSEDGDGGYGFDIDASYFLSLLYQKDYDFLFPVMGGSNLGLFRFLREHEDETQYLICGMDSDQQTLSNKIAFSVVKRFDLLIEDFLNKWLNEAEQPRKYVGTLESKDIDVVASHWYSEWSPVLEKFRKESIEMERRYLEAK